MWDSFCYIAVELSTVVAGKGIHVDGRVSQVKHESNVVMFLFLITHRVEGNLKVSHTGVRKMRGEERDLSHNVNAAKFNHPTHHTNKVLAELGAFRVKRVRDIQLGTIVQWEWIVSLGGRQ
jgi:hypothetical protein